MRNRYCLGRPAEREYNNGEFGATSLPTRENVLMDHLTLSFFGAFQATLGDRPLTAFRSAKVQGILVYLVLTQQPQPRDGLAALFWPDEPEAVAKQNLRQSIFRLRQVLGDADAQPAPYLLVTRLTVQFNPASDHV